MKRGPLGFLAVSILPLFLGAVPPAKAKRVEPAPPAPHAKPSKPPGISLDKLNGFAPGWTAVEAKGDAKEGSQEFERDVWPMFYLHWRPLAEGAPREMSVEDAGKLVSGLWEGFTLDGPLQGRNVTLPQHEAVLFETTTSHGEMKTRYFVWACPESLRVLVADMSLSLKANAPDVLLDWQSDMAATVRCHAGAALGEFPHLPLRYDIPGSDLSYAHPLDWVPVPGYKAQLAFGGADFTAARPHNTALEGQALILASDAVERLYFAWGPEPDYPMSYDVLRMKVADHWRPRSENLMITGTSVAGDIWIADGLVKRRQDTAKPHLLPLDWFRAWMWRKNGVTYLAVGQKAGVHLGRANPRISREERDKRLDRMFEAIQY